MKSLEKITSSFKISNIKEKCLSFFKKLKIDKSYKTLSKEGKKKYLKRKIKDGVANGGTILFGLATVAILVWMVVYIFTTGSGTLTWDFITSDYTKHTVVLRSPDDFDLGGGTFENSTNSQYFSEKWGVSFTDGVDNLQNPVVYIAHIEEGSPFNSLIDPNGGQYTINNSYYIGYLYVENNDGTSEQLSSGDLNAAQFAEAMDKAIRIDTSSLLSKGEGIRGSLLTTLMLIGFSLLFALPLGIGAAIYLGVYARKNPITSGIRTLIDVTSGIPSIIFGLAGAIIFIPFTNAMSGSTGGNIFSGALTMAIMLLPTIVKTTEEAIRVIPYSLTQASLALGASRTQTTFKVVLPNALPGILTSTLLSIGRIIGESAALVFAMGATIGDNPSLTDGNASLAVHIYIILGGEAPRYEAACAIAIIILIVVLVLSLLVKLISLKLNRFKGAN